MPDYKNGKIYKITSPNTRRVYYGSTVQSLSDRLHKHIYVYKCFLAGKPFNGERISFKVIKKGDAVISLVENFPCDTKAELLRRERWYIENNKCVNKKMPIQTNDERKEYNRKFSEMKRKNMTAEEKIERAKYQKKYMRTYQKLDRVKAKRYEKFNCECGGRYQYSSKAKHMKSKKHQAYISSLQ